MTALSTGPESQPLPESFRVAVIMERRPVTGNRWIDHSWRAMGVTLETQNAAPAQPRTIVDGENARQVLYGGYSVTLHKDECESYYHNLMAPRPRCYVVARPGANDEAPVPFLVSLSFDEAHAYLEGDEQVYDVDVPAELYRWTEAFVLKHYVPEKRRKRKRKDWRQEAAG
ncbi:DUF3305 domain-containing protein [Thiogranum longum]